jgi:hypothetical protein
MNHATDGTTLDHPLTSAQNQEKPRLTTIDRGILRNMKRVTILNSYNNNFRSG